MVTQAAVHSWAAPPFLLASWDIPVPIEELNPCVFLFADGPEDAEAGCANGAPIEVHWYARDDDLSLFHGRGVAFYSFYKRTTERLTLREFRELARSAGAGPPL